MSVPIARACSMNSMTRLAFPGRSPTVGFIWASAIRTGRALAARWRADLVGLIPRCYHGTCLTATRPGGAGGGGLGYNSAHDKDFGRGIREQSGDTRRPSL